MSYPGNAAYQRSSGNPGYPSSRESQHQQRRREAYRNQIQPRALQTHQYPSSATSQYPYVTSSYPSYTPRTNASHLSSSMPALSYDNDPSSPASGYPARNYSMSASAYDYDDDAASPSSAFSGRSYYDRTPCLSPVSPTTQRQQGDQPKLYYCLVEGCNKTTARAACLSRHATNVHFKAQAERIDCPVDGCARVGSKGFTRRDKLYEHMREVHHCDIPKRRGTAASRLSRPGTDNDQDEVEDFDMYVGEDL